MKTDWEVKKLGEVCQIIGGGTPSKGNSKFFNGDIPWATVRDMRSDIIDETEHKITDEAVKKSSTNIVQKNNVIIATRVGLGKVCLVKKDTAINQDLKGIIPKDLTKLSVNFLFHWLKSISDTIVEEGTGATVQGVKISFVQALQIPIPPLPEQQRIVAILDEAFAAIDQAKANAQRNLQNAKALFESYLQSVFANPGAGWEEKSLGTEIDLLCGFAFKSNRYTELPDDIRLLRGDNIMQGTLRWEDVKRWPSMEASEYSRYQLREGDIVLAMDRPWVKAGLKYSSIFKEDLPCLLVQRTARLRVNSTLDRRFLAFLLGSKEFTYHIIGVQSGIGVPHISAQQIKDFKFPYPPISEQKTIVAKLDALSAETKKLEAIYQQKLIDLDELKKSILQKAFRGELSSKTQGVALCE
jgi:type I restriction enzyme, S subunit